MNTLDKNISEKIGVTIGMLMGDMSAYIKKGNKNGTFSLTHSPKQECYLEYKIELMKKIGIPFFKIGKRVTTLKNGKSYEQLQTSSTVSKLAKALRKVMYTEDGVKIVTKKLLSKITDLGLLLWYLDDGYLSVIRKPNGDIKEYRTFMYTNCFTISEINLIKDWFEYKYDISPNINKKEGKYILYFNSTKTRKLMNIFSKFDIPECMKYKILSNHIV